MIEKKGKINEKGKMIKKKKIFFSPFKVNHLYPKRQTLFISVDEHTL